MAAAVGKAVDWLREMFGGDEEELPFHSCSTRESV